MRSSRTRSGLLLALVLATGACADALSGGSPLSLSATEVNQIFAEIATVFDGADLSLAKTAASQMMLDRQASIANTVNCSGGGTAGFSGTAATDGSSVDFTVTFSSCQTPHWMIDGSLHETVAVTSSSITHTLKGDLDLTSPDRRSGTCHVDATVTATGTNTPTTSGTICGVAASAVSGL